MIIVGFERKVMTGAPFIGFAEGFVHWIRLTPPRRPRPFHPFLKGCELLGLGPTLGPGRQLS